MYFGMYLDMILFIAGGFFAALGLIFIVYLMAFRKRNRSYAEVLRQETELFDALTATGNTSQGRMRRTPTQDVTAPSGTQAPTGAPTSQGASNTIHYNSYGRYYDTANPSDTSGFDPMVIANNYTIEREIGGGAMSRTFIVRNKKLGNQWFLKYISTKHGSLANEENILKLLNHPSLPKIIDVYRHENGVYLIVTLVDGIPLNTLEETDIKLSQYIILDWFEQMAQALNYLHSMKPTPVLHLDLKPGNIMVTHDNRLVLVDFGISRRFGEDVSGAVTASYAAPEQFRGRIPQKYAQLIHDRFGQLPPNFTQWQIDARTDIFSLGVIMFELATGQRPTRSNARTLANHVSKDAAAIIQKCLSINPAGRYNSAAELLEDLRKVKGSKIKMARTLLLRRIAAIAAILAIAISSGFFIGGYHVQAFENGATLALQPDIVTISLMQSTAVTIDRQLPDGRIVPMDTSQITWQATYDNIAHIDGGRITGMNVGETRITGRHRNSDITLSVRVVEPIHDIVEISQRYQTGGTVTLFAGTETRQRIDGSIAEMDFFSPESITVTADGTIYVSDAGIVRRISEGQAETIAKDMPFITADMVRSRGNEFFILTAPWREPDGSYQSAIARLKDSRVEFIFTSDAVRTAIEDFAFGEDGLLYMILRNEGLGVVLLKTLDITDAAKLTILTQLPQGSTSLTIAADGTIYIGNTSEGVIYTFINNELRNFAGLASERAFIDGTSPRFYSPQRLTYYGGHLYVWDFNTLRRISANRGIAGESTTLAGMASPVYERDLTITMHNAEDIILPHGRMMDIAVIDGRVLLTDHKRGVVWLVD